MKSIFLDADIMNDKIEIPVGEDFKTQKICLSTVRAGHCQKIIEVHEWEIEIKGTNNFSI